MIEIKNIIKILLCSIIATIVLVINNIFIDINISLFSIIETGIVFFSFYGIMLLVLKEQFTIEIVTNSLKKFMKK